MKEGSTTWRESAEKGTKNLDNQKRIARAVRFFYFFKKGLAIHQKCGIIRVQKQHSKNTERNQEENRMKITIKVNGKRISKKVAIANFGEECIKRRIEEAKQAYAKDPWELNTWMDGMEIKVAE